MVTFLAAWALLAGVAPAEPQNTLSASEKRQGWQLLFDGKTTAGWRNFRSDSIRPGWKVEEGALVCADPYQAGDIVTTDEFQWFELRIDYRMSPGSNSGIMFHSTEEEFATWATGPEIQLYDNRADPNGQLAGWLYDLYRAPVDTTKPAGEWNSLRIVIAPKKSEVFMNGTKYYEFVLGSQEFKERVAKSKFGSMSKFAVAGKGRIALQGDHGVVAFRNIKIRPIR
jgi:hypothetical protein